MRSTSWLVIGLVVAVVSCVSSSRCMADTSAGVGEKLVRDSGLPGGICV